jgi:uncharacterized repeat protein (TIGR02543 family)
MKRRSFVTGMLAVLLAFGLALAGCDNPSGSNANNNNNGGGATYTVTFNGNGGTSPASQTVNAGDPLALPSTTRSGYTLDGWYTASSGGTKAGNAGESYMPPASITLYARWTQDGSGGGTSYTVTFDGNGGTSPASQTVNAGSSTTLPSITRSGYTLNGWYATSSGGTKIGDAEASYTPTASITLYAQWTQDESGGNNTGKVGTPTASPSAGEVTSGTKITLSTATTGATVYYTINGNTPTASSIKYVTSITITAATTIKAIAVKSGMTDSDVFTAAYTIGTGDDDGGNTGGGGTTTTKPIAPTGLNASNTGNIILPNIRVSWDSVSDATSYKLYRSASASGTYTQVGTSTTSTYASDDNPRSGNNFYKVKAVNSAGESDFSSYASFNFDTHAAEPGTPTVSGTTSGSTNIKLTWSFPTGVGNGVPTSIKIRAINPDSGAVADITTLSGTATTYTFNYLPWVSTAGGATGNVKMAVMGTNEYGSTVSRTLMYVPSTDKWY